METLIGIFFLDFISGYIREVIDSSERGDDKYLATVPNQDCFEVVSGEFIRTCLEIAGER